jgi:hypothetical protein
MKTSYLGFAIGLPYAAFTLLFPSSFMRIAHVLFPSLGIVVVLSLITFERRALHVRNSLVTGLCAILVLTVGSLRSPFLAFKTWIFTESGEIAVHTGVQNWLVGVFFSMVALYLTLTLWLLAERKSTLVQKAGFLGGLIAALPWALSGKYGIPPAYDVVISIISFLLLALPGLILLKYRESSVRNSISSAGIAWSTWAFLVIIVILYTSPRMWIFPDNWDFITLKMSILSRYLPVWMLFSILVLALGRGFRRVLTSDQTITL